MVSVGFVYALVPATRSKDAPVEGFPPFALAYSCLQPCKPLEKARNYKRTLVVSLKLCNISLSRSLARLRPLLASLAELSPTKLTPSWQQRQLWAPQ